MRSIGVPRTAIVCPFALMVLLCAALSIPLARPLTTMTLCFARTFVILLAALRPLGEAFREPITATRGEGKGLAVVLQRRVVLAQISFLCH